MKKTGILFLLIPAAVLLFQFSHPLRNGPGDVNNDGAIDVLDVVRCVAIIMGDIEPTEYELWAGDVNGDEMTDVLDIIIMVDYIMEDNEPCPYLYSPCQTDLSLCCPDTSSHAMTWVIDTLGAYGTYSYITDIAVIDSANIYVTGRIWPDGFEGEQYNVAHWNGFNWEYEQLLYTGWPPGSQNGAVMLGQSVFVFEENDIYIVAGTTFHWDGVEWTEMYVPWVFNGAVTNMWGSPSGDLFFVGHSGTFVYYDGEEFIPVETGSNMDLKSVWGTNSEDVWACGHNLLIGEFVTGLYHYDGTEWRAVYEGEPLDQSDDHISGVIYSVYSDVPDSVFVATTWGLYRCGSDSNGECELVGDLTGWSNEIKDIQGNNHHDIYLGGALATVWHYNGMSFHQYMELSQLEGSFYIKDISVKGDAVALSGTLLNTAQGFVIRGFRE